MFDVFKKQDQVERIKPKLLTLKQASELIEGLTEYRLRRLCVEEKIKHHKFGGKYMVLEQVLLNYFGIEV